MTKVAIVENASMLSVVMVQSGGNKIRQLLLLAYAVKIHNWSTSRVKLGQATVQLGKRAGFDDVGHRLCLTTGAQISVFSDS